MQIAPEPPAARPYVGLISRINDTPFRLVVKQPQRGCATNFQFPVGSSQFRSGDDDTAPQYRRMSRSDEELAALSLS